MLVKIISSNTLHIYVKNMCFSCIVIIAMSLSASATIGSESPLTQLCHYKSNRPMLSLLDLYKILKNIIFTDGQVLCFDCIPHFVSLYWEKLLTIWFLNLKTSSSLKTLMKKCEQKWKKNWPSWLSSNSNKSYTSVILPWYS